MGLLARFFKGGLPIRDMMRMKFRGEIDYWYFNYFFQVTEENLIQKLKYDKNGKIRELPSNERIRKLVIHKILEEIKEGHFIWKYVEKLKGEISEDDEFEI